MAEHRLDIKVEKEETSTVASNGLTKDFNNQLKKASLALGRLSPEMRQLGMTFRTLINLSNAFGTNLGSLMGLIGTIGLIKKGFDLVEDHFANLAKAAQEAAEAFAHMTVVAAEIRADRMKEGGVSEEERQRATFLRDDAQFRRKNLEDLYLDVDRARRKGGKNADAYAIMTMMQSGLYSEQTVNDLVEKGGLKGLFGDLEEKIKSARAEEKAWEDVLKPEKEKKEKEIKMEMVKTTWLDDMSRKGLYMSSQFAAMGGGYNEIEVMKD